MPITMSATIGSTEVNAPEGRVDVHITDPDVPGITRTIKVTDEGVIIDIWRTDEHPSFAGDDTDLIATYSQTHEEILETPEEDQ